MAVITDYGSLQTAVADYLNREDLVSNIPQFIQFAENRIYRELRTPGNEKFVTYRATEYDNSASIQLPIDYLEAKLVIWDDRALERKSDQYFTRRDPNRASATPLRFSRIGGFLFFDPPGDTNADVDLYYYFVNNLSDDTPTTNMLTVAPELFLYGALLEAIPFLKNDERIPVWQGLYEKAFADVMAQAWDAEYAGSTVTVNNIYSDSHLRLFRGEPTI